MDSVQTLWGRIEVWMSKHAPFTWQKLPSGVREEEIQQAEEALGIALPQDFKISYRMHNGHFRAGSCGRATVAGGSTGILASILKWFDAQLPDHGILPPFGKEQKQSTPETPQKNEVKENHDGSKK